MSIFFWKNNKMIDKFARNLADEFYSRIGPDVAREYTAKHKEKKKKKQEAKARDNAEKLIQSAAAQLNSFKMERKLGVYGKARFHLTFTERLQELGYEEPLAKKINEILLLRSP